MRFSETAKGLTSLAMLLPSIFLARLGYKEKDEVSPDNKYNNIFHQPTEEYLVMTPVFCPKCHQQACMAARGKDGKTHVALNGNTFVVTSMEIPCPNGHPVHIGGRDGQRS